MIQPMVEAMISARTASGYESYSLYFAVFHLEGASFFRIWVAWFNDITGAYTLPEKDTGVTIRPVNWIFFP